VKELSCDRLALNLAGEKDFGRITIERFERLAEKAALPRRETLATVERIVAAVAAPWPEVRRVSEIPREIAGRIDAHMLALPLVRGKRR
jgi:hypothetical protein